MTQNTPRDDATSGQPPTEPVSGDGSAWNQPEQTAPDPAQAGQAPAGQEAAAEYAAWSADAAYQQQPAQQQPAQQAAPPADAGAYAAPEPQSATYSDPATTPPADQQAYDAQQQAYAAQQQQQQAYAAQQQAYAAQQQQAYDAQQQAYAAQQQQQQPYDQQAQQQAYQQQPYDQQAQQQQQPYDQQAQQQPGYYDPQAYAQQQYQQQGYQQPQYQQGQPYTYAQPGQQQQWPGQEQYWEEGGTGYGRSFMAVLSGFVLLTWGLVFAMGGGLVIWLGNLNEIVGDLTLSAEAVQLIDEFNKQATAFGGIVLILGLMQLIGAIGIWSHRKWGRAFGIILGLLGTIWGVGILVAAVGFEALNSSIEIAIEGEEASMAAGFLVLATYLLVLVAMFVGRRHFRKKGIAS